MKKFLLYKCNNNNNLYVSDLLLNIVINIYVPYFLWVDDSKQILLSYFIFQVFHLLFGRDPFAFSYLIRLKEIIQNYLLNYKMNLCFLLMQL